MHFWNFVDTGLTNDRGASAVLGAIGSFKIMLLIPLLLPFLTDSPQLTFHFASEPFLQSCFREVERGAGVRPIQHDSVKSLPRLEATAASHRTATRHSPLRGSNETALTVAAPPVFTT